MQKSCGNRPGGGLEDSPSSSLRLEKSSEPDGLRIERLRDNPVSSRFCDRLANGHGLGRDQLHELLALRTRRIYYPRGHAIAREFEPVPPAIVVSGWIAAQCILENGDRQIFDLLAPGDAIGISEKSRKGLGRSLVALAEVVAVDGASLFRSRPPHVSGLSQALSSLERDAEGRLYDHIERLGRRNSYSRLADFLVDIHTRLQNAGALDGSPISFPIKQSVLADFLGLTVMHLNRTLKQMQQDGLIKIGSGLLEIKSLDLLRSARGRRRAAVAA